MFDITQIPIKEIISLILLILSIVLGNKWRKFRRKFKEFADLIEAINNYLQKMEANPEEAKKEIEKVIKEAEELINDP